MPRLTKAAQAAQAEIAHEERLRAALRWTEDIPAPDVAPPGDWPMLTTGYVFNAHTSRVHVACSSSMSHAIGRTDKATVQGSLWLYSTRCLALQALRAALQRECATRLVAVDLLIEAEENT